MLVVKAREHTLEGEHLLVLHTALGELPPSPGVPQSWVVVENRLPLWLAVSGAGFRL